MNVDMLNQINEINQIRKEALSKSYNWCNSDPEKTCIDHSYNVTNMFCKYCDYDNGNAFGHLFCDKNGECICCSSTTTNEVKIRCLNFPKLKYLPKRDQFCYTHCIIKACEQCSEKLHNLKQDEWLVAGYDNYDIYDSISMLFKQ